jgi:hypothetical protein
MTYTYQSTVDDKQVAMCAPCFLFVILSFCLLDIINKHISDLTHFDCKKKKTEDWTMTDLVPSISKYHHCNNYLNYYDRLGYPERCHNHSFNFKCFRLHYFVWDCLPFTNLCWCCPLTHQGGTFISVIYYMNSSETNKIMCIVLM